MEKDINRIKSLSKKKENENWEFRSFLKWRSSSSRKLDQLVHKINKDVSSKIDCRTCANCCIEIKPILQKKDIDRISNHLNITSGEFIETYLYQDEDGDFLFKSKNWNIKKQVNVKFLEASANKLCDDSVKISVDSSFQGYSVSTLTDGIKATSGLAWAEAAWASGEHGQQHWILCEFAKPEITSTVTVHWAASGGGISVSREIELWHEETIGKWIRLAITNPPSTELSTIIKIPPQLIYKLKLRQPPNKGSDSRPELLWLREFEVF